MDHSWAGDTVTWGLDNRSCALRVLTTTPGSTRIESRVPGADTNPYISLAASLAGFVHGIENELEAPEPIVGDAYALEGVEKIPNDLPSAVALLDQSALARELLGRGVRQLLRGDAVVGGGPAPAGDDAVGAEPVPVIEIWRNP